MVCVAGRDFEEEKDGVAIDINWIDRANWPSNFADRLRRLIRRAAIADYGSRHSVGNR